MQGDWNDPGVQSDVYISGEFAIMTQEMANRQDTTFRVNAAAQTLRAGLKSIVVVSLLAFTLLV